MPDRLVTHNGIEWLEPEWPAPEAVRALSSLRKGGVSEGCWDSLNLGDHVGDISDSVKENRQALSDAAGLPAEPFWLKQVHGCQVADTASDETGCEADAVITNRVNDVCAVMTADCLPVLITDRAGTKVAATHAGWRGLCDGVLEETLRKFRLPASGLMAWLGPAISV